MAPLLVELARRLREWSSPATVPSGRRAPAPADFLDEETFERWAMRIHAAQRKANPLLRRFWDAAADHPPTSWRDVPPVPATAFKDVAICSGPAEAVFRTSGTSMGTGRRGEHHVASLDLYRAAARGHYRAALFEGIESALLVSLVPAPHEAPDSSLGAMAGFVAGEPEVSRTVWAFDAARGVRMGAFRDAVADATQPVVLLATAFALVHLLDALGAPGLGLPEGSRIMETGGFKGKVAHVDRADLYERVANRLGVPQAFVVNEYGMTELLSQAYDGIAGRAPPIEARVHRFPPWVRMQALDPVSLEPLPPGEQGLLAIFDLANAGSACHVLTQDMGLLGKDGAVRLRGRASGAEARGCSLAAESFVRASGARRR